MAKLGSSSCRPLRQRMMLPALLLLASIHAGPVMALNEQVAADLTKLVDKVTEMTANTGLTKLGKKKGWKDFSNGGKAGIKLHKYLCKAQGWMDKQNPGGDNFDTLASSNGLGRGGYLSSSFPSFSYNVTSEEGGGNSVVVCWSSQPHVPAAGTGASTTLVPSRYPNDGRYYVRITGIRVGQEELPVQTPAELNRPPPPAYLSTAQPYTYLESSLYGRLRAAVIGQTNALNPGATPSLITADKLCYSPAALSVPHRLLRIAILLASNNVMQTMELGGSADTVWYRDSSMFCLGILPATTVEPVLGSMIQSGRMMTIDLTAAGGLGTLTF
ncbi:uncharacterized protein [Miscanthus floridulus]|uniref:uncharacterized protein n=1 Tax=Miscanthus floridulus TaxID=154761 RepID=UPI003457E7C7